LNDLQAKTGPKRFDVICIEFLPKNYTVCQGLWPSQVHVGTPSKYLKIVP